MSVAVHPVTEQRLSQFQRRRLWLLAIRVIAVALSAWIIGLFLVIAADSLWLLSDAVRWTISLTAHCTGAAIAAWGLRRSERKPDTAALARGMEELAPPLRQNLLAALELSQASSQPNSGSPRFLALLQEHVAAKIADVNVRQLLPARLVRRWLLVALALVSLCVALLAWPNSQWPQRFARAIYPGANIARISRVRVEILRPTPPSQTVPQHEAVALEVRVTPDTDGDVWVETTSPSSGTTRQPLRPNSEQRYFINLMVENEVVEYRVLAGDAITERHYLEPVARPTAKSFQKTYQPPRYTKLDRQQVTEDHGHLASLAGSTADVVIEVDQQLEVATLEIFETLTGQTRSQPLERVDDLHWQATLPMDQPGQYRVHLVSAKSGFDNPLSPKYEIKPLPDHPPRVQLADLGTTYWLVPADEVIDLKAMVEDELPLAELEQWISVNGATWQMIDRPLRPESKFIDEWKWDLLPLSASVGDQVRTKLVAVDRKGQRSESQTLELLITSSAFDPQRHAMVDLRASLMPAIREYAQSMEKTREASRSWIEAFQQELSKPKQASAEQSKDQEKGDAKKLTVRQDAARALEKHRVETVALREKVIGVYRQLTDVEDAEELEMILRVLARVEHQWITNAQSWLDEEWPTIDDQQRRVDFDQLRHSMQEAIETGRQLEQRYQASLSHDIAVAVALDASAITKHQLQANAPEIYNDWTRLSRHQRVTQRQLEAVDRFLTTHQAYFDQQYWLQWLRDKNSRLETALDSNEDLKFLQQMHGQIERELTSIMGQHHGNVRWQVFDSRKEYERRGGFLMNDLQQLAQAARQYGENQRKGTSQKGAGDSQQVLTQSQRLWQELVKIHQPRIAQIVARRAVQQQNKTTEPVYVSDLGLVDRAARVVLGKLQTPGSASVELERDLQTVAEAFAVLESGGIFVDAQRKLTSLLNDERWKSQQPIAKMEHAKRWQFAQIQLENAANLMRQAKIQNEIVGKVDEMRWKDPVQQINKKFEERFGQNTSWAATDDEIAQVVALGKDVATQLQPIMEAARQKLRDLAPTLSDLAKQAAEEVRKLEEETQKLANETKNAEQKADTEKELAEPKQAAEERVDKLVNALMDLADAQQVTTPEGRRAAQQADQHLQTLREATEPVREAMRDAAQAFDSQQQADQLETAAEKQANLAETLDKLAEKLGENASQDSEQNANSSESSPSQPQAMQENYSEAERLQRLAQADPQEIMRQLEKELPKNPAMQQELSEISKAAANEALATLQHAERREQEFQQKIEQADREFSQQKQQLAERLQEISSRTQNMSNTMLGRTADIAAQANQPAVSNQVRQTQQQTAKEAQEASSVNAQQTAEKMHEAAKELANQLREAANQAEQAKNELQKAQDQPISDKEQERLRQKEVAERRQRELREERARTADSMVRDAENRKRTAENQVRESQNQQRQAEQRLKQAEQQLEKAKDNEGLKQNVANHQQQLQAVQKERERREALLQAAEQKVQQRREQVEAIRKEDLPEIQAKNPAAELARRLAERSAEEAKKLAEEAEKLAQAQEWESQLRPNANELANAATQQQQVQRDVQQAAADVSRTSRHEQRLGNEQAASQLSERAEGIDKTEKQEVAQATERLRKAGEPPAGQGQPSQNNQPASSEIASPLAKRRKRPSKHWDAKPMHCKKCSHKHKLRPMPLKIHKAAGPANKRQPITKSSQVKALPVVMRRPQPVRHHRPTPAPRCLLINRLVAR